MNTRFVWQAFRRGFHSENPKMFYKYHYSNLNEIMLLISVGWVHMHRATVREWYLSENFR